GKSSNRFPSLNSATSVARHPAACSESQRNTTHLWSTRLFEWCEPVEQPNTTSRCEKHAPGTSSKTFEPYAATWASSTAMTSTKKSSTSSSATRVSPSTHFSSP